MTGLLSLELAEGVALVTLQRPEKRPRSAAPDQPTSSLWSSSGSSWANAGSLLFSLIWHFQR